MNQMLYQVPLAKGIVLLYRYCHPVRVVIDTRVLQRLQRSSKDDSVSCIKTWDDARVDRLVSVWKNGIIL